MSTKPFVRAAFAAISVLGGLLLSPLPVAAERPLTDRNLAAAAKSTVPALATPGAALTCGGLIAYNEMTGGLSSSRLLAVPVTGGSPRVVWDGPHAPQGEFDPAWSPDGRSIAFIGLSPTETPGLVDTRLYVLRPGASEPNTVVTQLAQRGGLRFPTWSPDGTRIAYTTGVPPPGQNYKGLAWVHIVDLTTGIDILLTGVPGSLVTPDVTWSPSGDLLLITAWEAPNTGNWTIFSVRPDPTDPRLTAVISNDPDIHARVAAQRPTIFPAFLPRGRVVLVEQEGPDELSSRLYLADPIYRHLLPVSPSEGWSSQPDFGSSPLRAAYQRLSNDRSQTSIAVLSLPTGTSRTLVPSTAGVTVERPDWQPVIGCRPWPFAT
jgi:dipeptidyl aminopeptidase/acylaminoacyl peptidase